MGVHRSFKFCLLTLAGVDRPVDEASFVFFAHEPSDLKSTERRFTLSPDDLALINPNTKTAPIFSSRRDAEITKAIYRRIPILVRDDDPDGNPWGVEWQTMFHMTNDSQLFRTAEELRVEGAALEGNIWTRCEERWLPLYEAKMMHHFDHRFGDYAMKAVGNKGSALPDVPLEQVQDASYVVQPRYWVAESEVRGAMRDPLDTWLLGFRRIAHRGNLRTVIASALPAVACGNSFPLIRPAHPRLRALFASVFNSFIQDFIARQKLAGTDANFFVVKQLAVLAPAELEKVSSWAPRSVADWLRPRVLELTYTAWDLEGSATDLGYDGAPFRWEPSRRELLRAELDAAFFHLYEIDRDAVDYILDTFPIVRRDDEKKHGEYRTKRLILERYDALAEATDTGIEYLTALDPPPADPRVAHIEAVRPTWATLGVVHAD